jgi:hypothetical protein
MGGNNATGIVGEGLIRHQPQFWRYWKPASSYVYVESLFRTCFADPGMYTGELAPRIFIFLFLLELRVYFFCI